MEESFRLNWTEKVETAWYRVLVYHQSKDASRTFSVAPLQVAFVAFVEYEDGFGAVPVPVEPYTGGAVVPAVGEYSEGETPDGVEYPEGAASEGGVYPEGTASEGGM